MAGTVLGARDIIVNQTDKTLPSLVREGAGSWVRLLGFESWTHSR